MQCALLLFRTPDLPAPLAKLSPWLDMNTRPLDEVRADLEAQTHRRFIKTHLPLGAVPWDERVTYLHVGRDPRDAGLSWDNHVANVDFDRLHRGAGRRRRPRRPGRPRHGRAPRTLRPTTLWCGSGCGSRATASTQHRRGWRA